ncbi:MAG: S-layer homology domain-containing protein [Lachnospirales bacterium]
MKRKIGLFLVMSMMLSSAVTVSAATFNDTSGHWAEAAIDQWSDYGVVSGYTDGTFKPADNITRAEIAALIDKMMKYESISDNSFADLNGDEWYAECLLKNVAAGNISGYTDGTIGATNNVTRQEVALILCNAFNIEGVPGNTTFADDSDIPDWSKPSINALQSAGYINGRDGNLFVPSEIITRAEVVSMLDSIVSELYYQSGTYYNVTAGNALVNAEDVVLKDARILGNLYIAAGVKNGVTLDNFLVSGETINEGGNSVNVSNSNETQNIETESLNPIFKQTDDYSITLSYILPEAPITVVVIKPVTGKEPITGYTVSVNGVSTSAVFRSEQNDYIATLDGTFTVNQLAITVN